MNGLISRKALMKDVQGMILCDIKIKNRVLDLIQGQPTACDLDKVLEQLEENKINCKNSNTIFDTDDYVKLDKFIEIVRGGNKNE